jgi:threonyl-tRNA synthetase
VVGPRDAEAGTVSVRRKGEGDLGAMPLAGFLERVQREIREKTR